MPNVSTRKHQKVPEIAGSAAFTSQVDTGLESAEKPIISDTSLSKSTSLYGSNVPGGGYSSAVERSVHIGKALGSIPSTPTTRRFRTIWDQGFAEYFWRKVAIGEPQQCWPWTRATQKDGYGQVKAGGKFWAASRLALTLATGSELGAALALHHCDNPLCCNPSHLYAGTKADNERDKHRRGRVSFKGSKNPAAKLTTDQVSQVIEYITAGCTNIAIAAQFGVHHSTISKIRRGKSWA